MTFRIMEEVSVHPGAGRPCGPGPGQPRGCNDPVGLKLFGQGGEILGDGNRTGAPGLFINYRVVVGVGIYVVGDESPIFGLDEFEACNPDVPVAAELQIAINDRIPEALTPVEEARRW